MLEVESTRQVDDTNPFQGWWQSALTSASVPYITSAYEWPSLGRSRDWHQLDLSDQHQHLESDVSWLITPQQKIDADALAYLDLVEKADGQALEAGVRTAVINFVTGCKADGIWDAIKASCILAGARTQAGALIPLVGTAPTLVGTAGGWTYNRKAGIKGNGTNNGIDSNRASNQDPQNSAHVAFYIGTIGSGASFFDNATSTTARLTFYDTGSSGRGQLNTSTSVTGLGVPTGGFAGFSRSASNAWVNRVNGSTSATRTTPSSVTTSGTIIFQARRNTTTGVLEFLRTDAVPFYSVGESLNLELLDARVTTLITAFDSAIA